MNTDRFSDLPEWDDSRYDEDEESEGWKPNATREACRALYGKWREVVFLLRGVVEPIIDGAGEDSMEKDMARDMLADAHMVAAKIRSSEAGGIYVIRMENAAIIRMLAQGIASALLVLGEENDINDSYITVVRNEIADFRQLFIEWVNTFEKDEFGDEWGLFV